MLESMFVKEGFQIGLISPKAFPLGVEQSGGLFGQVQAKPPYTIGGPAKPGRMRGRFGTQPFLVEKGGLLTVASTAFFFCPVGQPGRPLIRHLR